MHTGLPNYNDVTAAAQRLAGIAHRTPVMTSRFADQTSGGRLYFKCENFQRVGAFKFRGAYNAISRFDTAQRAAGVLAFSSGNHAQAVALSAKLQGIHATILMPSDAPSAKLAATKGYGAEIITYDRFVEDRETIGKGISEERGMTLIPPYDHADIIAGQGTAAQELFEEVGELDLLLVPLGGGGLLAGSALVAAALNRNCQVIGVEPEAGNDGQQSFSKGEIVTIPVPKTIADGAQTTYLGTRNFPIIRQYVREITTVSDQQLIATLRFFAERMKLIVEPTGCLAAAAVLQRVIPVENKRVGILISGGNVDLGRFAELINGQLCALINPQKICERSDEGQGLCPLTSEPASGRRAKQS